MKVAGNAGIIAQNFPVDGYRSGRQSPTVNRETRNVGIVNTWVGFKRYVRGACDDTNRQS